MSHKKKKDAIEIVTGAFEKTGRPPTQEDNDKVLYMIGLTKSRLEEWHEQLRAFRKEMGNPPIGFSDRHKSGIWYDILEQVTSLMMSIRLFHGDWRNTKAFKDSLARLEKTKEDIEK